jgi:Ammonium Transporter Family
MIPSLSTGDSSTFANCVNDNPDGNATVLLQCVSDQYQQADSEAALQLRSFLLVSAGAMIFFMQTGFAMLCAGCVRLKNVQNTMLKNLLDACGAAIAFFLIGECNSKRTALQRDT